MAFTVDQQLGTNSKTTTAQTNVTLTTAATVATGGLIVIAAGSFLGGAITSITFSGGALTWTTAKFEISSLDTVALGWALAPAGLVSGTVLTATANSANLDGPSIGATSYAGAQTTTPQDGAANGNAPANGTAWDGGAIVPTAGDLVVVAGWGDGSATTQTPSVGFTQSFLLAQATNGDNLVLNHQLSAAGGSITPGGTWGATQTNRGAVAAFLPAGVAAGIPDLIMAPPHR